MSDIEVTIEQSLDHVINGEIVREYGTFNYEELDNKPSINGVELVGNKTNADLGIEVDTSKFPTREELDDKQDKGDYALKEEIPDLTDYVKNTDYAGTDGSAGLIKTSSSYGTQMVTSGYIRAGSDNLDSYKTRGVNFFVGKGTLENIKDDYVKRGITENQTELTDDEKASAKQWLGYATQSDINTAIANLPQFKISILDTLPETGEKMVLYLVPKDGEAPDVYNEYIWIEDTSSFEFLGSTAVDLTDYVKNTDYAGIGGKAGVIKVSAAYGFSLAPSNGYLTGISRTLEQFEATQTNAVISKGTLENIKDDYVKRGLTENTIELTDDEKTSARTLIGAISNTDYAQGSVGGVVKASGTFACGVTNGYLQTTQLPVGTRYDNLSQYAFIGKGTLENIKNDLVKRAVTTNDIELTEDEKTSARTWLGAVGDTDYATASKAGILTPSSYYATAMSGQYLYTQTKTLDQYKESVNGIFIGKGTLENVLTQFSKTVLTTEADYEALTTKDTNTLYLIEEE